MQHLEGRAWLMIVRGLFLTILLAAPLAAQSPQAAVPDRSLAERPAQRFGPPPSGLAARPAKLGRQSRAAFPVELLGAAAGSLAGLGAGLLIASPDDCDNEDLACILERIGFAGLLSIAGAPAGAVLAGNRADTRPSVVGAALGSIAGAVAAAGLLKLGEEINDGSIPVVYALIAYGGAHGLLTAAGSRIGALVRD